MGPKYFKEDLPMINEEKILAQESDRTERNRKKIAKLLDDTDKMFTQENLEKAKMQNRERLYRQTDRLPVDPSEGLFDANQNPEKMSARVKKMADAIREYLDTNLG